MSTDTLDIDAVTAAVNHLVAYPGSIDKILRHLRAVVAEWSETPRHYVNEDAILNALVAVGIQQPAALDRLIALVKAQRAASPVDKKTRYQKDLMRDLRQRKARAVELYELNSLRKLRGNDRSDYIKQVEERWRAEKEEFLASKGELSWAGKNAAIAEFWRRIDENLEKNLELARFKARRK